MTELCRIIRHLESGNVLNVTVTAQSSHNSRAPGKFSGRKTPHGRSLAERSRAQKTVVGALATSQPLIARGERPGLIEAQRDGKRFVVRADEKAYAAPKRVGKPIASG
jgi:hypothetical protein